MLHRRRHPRSAVEVLPFRTARIVRGVPLKFREARIAGEHLVAAVSGAAHLDVRPRQAREMVGRNHRRIRERLIEMPRQPIEAVHGGRCQHAGAGARAAPRGHRTRVRQLVVVAVLESDRERVDRPVEELRRHGGERARVDPSGEKDADRTIAGEVETYRFVQLGVEARGTGVLVGRLRLEREVPVFAFDRPRRQRPAGYGPDEACESLRRSIAVPECN